MKPIDEYYDNFISYLTTRQKDLKKNLKMARMNKSPHTVVEEAVKMSILLTITVSFIIFLILNRAEISLLFLIPAFPALLFLFYKYRLMNVRAKVVKRQREIDRDVLFAGRYLLVKLNSGQPLVNALADAANSDGTANKYFREIMNDIDLGKPVEDALQEAAEYSPSDKFRKIVFKINNALKIGIDVTEFLRETLEEIIDDQILEIKRYGKKLNSVTLFYLLVGIVIPSLGMTIITLAMSISEALSGWVFYGLVLFALTLLQSIFVIVYKQIRPNLNI